MATAKDELQEVTGEERSGGVLAQYAKELKAERAKEEEGLPTIREALAEIGRDPEKYGDILDKSGSMALWEEVYKPQNTLETGALTLLAAARQSGSEPEEYLSRLAPYFDSKVQYLPRLSGALGKVEYGKPRTAVLTLTSKALGRMGGTLPHELEHTLQKTRKDAPGYGEVTASKAASDISGRMVRRFGSRDERYDDLQERLAALPEEQRNQITDRHPVFGNYLRFGDELMARLRAAEMLEAARGGDFYQSEMGQALFPTDDDKAYMVGSTLPGEANMTPPWSFERTDEAPTSVEDQRKSYARRLLEMLPGYAEGGEVLPQTQTQPPMTDYVFPDRPRDYVSPSSTTSAADLQRLGTQAGLFGLGFAPGAGMADYFGQFPSAEGGTEPSAMQNIQQGNYGTAAMQGLGAMGDLMYAVPVLGATVGTALKGPRTAQRMLQELPKTDELGFYSQVEKAVLDNPQKKGTGEQFLAQIQKTPGVKQEELQYTGLDQFLAGKPSVTKGEIQDYLDANKVQVQEVVLGGRTQKQRINDAFDEAGISNVRVPGFDEEFFDTRNNRGLTADELPTALKNKLQEIEATPELSSPAAPRFETYTRPGGTNYRELYLTLPTKQLSEAEAKVVLGARPDAQLTEADISFASNKAMDQYRVPEAHSVSTEADVNRLAQLRVNDRVIDGKNTLFIEEIQSDWHQAGRKQGYRGDTPAMTFDSPEYVQARINSMELRNEFNGNNGNPERQAELRPMMEAATAEERRLSDLVNQTTRSVPDAPFKTSWDELALKRAIKLASDEGYDQIAFTTGKTQADRYNLSKQVDRISYFKKPDGQYHVVARDKRGQDVELGTNNSLEDLEGKVGKALTEKISRGEGNFSGGDFTDLTGVDLEVGGEGMKGFYDKMLPKKLDKIGKKYGAKVGKTTMDTPDGPVEVWSMQLPDDLKETVSTQGQPLFQLGAGAAGTAGIMSLTGEDAEAAQ